ncbi:hypothetical protein ACR6HW_12325 [Fusibacter sp. JL298sf-3]
MKQYKVLMTAMVLVLLCLSTPLFASETPPVAAGSDYTVEVVSKLTGKIPESEIVWDQEAEMWLLFLPMKKNIQLSAKDGEGTPVSIDFSNFAPKSIRIDEKNATLYSYPTEYPYEVIAITGYFNGEVPFKVVFFEHALVKMPLTKTQSDEVVRVNMGFDRYGRHTETALVNSVLYFPIAKDEKSDCHFLVQKKLPRPSEKAFYTDIQKIKRSTMSQKGIISLQSTSFLETVNTYTVTFSNPSYLSRTDLYLDFYELDHSGYTLIGIYPTRRIVNGKIEFPLPAFSNVRNRANLCVADLKKLINIHSERFAYAQGYTKHFKVNTEEKDLTEHSVFKDDNTFDPQNTSQDYYVEVPMIREYFADLGKVHYAPVDASVTLMYPKIPAKEITKIVVDFYTEISFQNIYMTKTYRDVEDGALEIHFDPPADPTYIQATVHLKGGDTYSTSIIELTSENS